MRLFGFTFLATGLLTAAVGIASADHLGKCLGTWKLVSGNRAGTDLLAEESKDVTLTFKEEDNKVKLVVKAGDKVMTEATVKLIKKGDQYDQYDIAYTKGFNQKKSLEGKTLRG